jgi:hypothetical protein
VDSELFLGPIGFRPTPSTVTVLTDANEMEEGPLKRTATSELDLGAGVGTSGMTSSSYGNRKVDLGDDMISCRFEFETSTHETDLGILGIFSVFADDLDLRRLVEILRQSLPSERERDGLKIFFSGSTIGSGAAISISSSGNDKRGVGFGRAVIGAGRGMFGELHNDSFDKNGPRALDDGCPASLLDRCTPRRTVDGDTWSVGVR